jgi:amino acid transporter
MNSEHDREAELLASFGYDQELDRAMGWFSSFAVSFSGVSITAAIFLTLPFALGQAGTAGLLTWILSSIGALLVAFIFADLVGRIPVAGYAYQWTSRLANPRVGWFVAVAGLIGFGVGAAGTIYGLTPFFLTEFHIDVTRNSNIFGAIVFTLIVAAINIVGIRLAAQINNAAVITEIVGGVGVGLALFVYALVEHPHPVSFFFHEQPGPHSGLYFSSFVLAFLLGAFTYAAWELPADLAEETKDATNVAARTMIWSIVAVAVGGTLLLISYTYASPGIDQTLASSTPILSIIDYQWGSTAKEIINVVFLVSFFAVSMLILAGAVRLLYSLSRDNMAPGSGLFRRVSPRFNTPYFATIGMSLFAIGMFTIPALLSSTVLGYIIGTASVGYNLVYGAVAAIFIWNLRRGTLPESHGSFTLGRWSAVVGWAVLVWQVFIVGTLTLPKVNRNIGWTTIIMLAVGAVWYVVWVRPQTARGNAGPAMQRQPAATDDSRMMTAGHGE